MSRLHSILLFSTSSLLLLLLARGSSRSPFRAPAASTAQGDFVARHHRSGDLRGATWRYIYSIDDYGDDDGDGDRDLVLNVCNNLKECAVYLCWVTNNGHLKHYRPIDNGSIIDGSVSNCHSEYSQKGHAFVCFKQPTTLPQTLEDLNQRDFLFIYRPTLAKHCHNVTINDSEITITCEKMDDEEVIDNTKKVYNTMKINGFTIRYEGDVLSKEQALLNALSEDLSFCSTLLPASICNKLKESTSIYVNKSISFGRKRFPIFGRACTYHSKYGRAWLASNGMSEEKAGSVEMYNTDDYLGDRYLWGVGGSMLHELCHAYHDKHCLNGFENKTINDAYVAAMGSRSYDAVRVHGPQGADDRKVKAYACTNCMEFFAELSTAYLWTQDDSTEYNKWFPHNRAQLAQHDPKTAEMLSIIWGY